MKQSKLDIARQIRTILYQEMEGADVTYTDIADISEGLMDAGRVEEVVKYPQFLSQVALSYICDACCTGMNQRAYLLRLHGMMQ